MARKVSLFDKEISPACEYCAYGKRTDDYDMIMCPRKGIVSPFFRCRRFTYNPIRREPKRDDSHMGFKPEDFSL